MAKSEAKQENTAHVKVKRKAVTKPVLSIVVVAAVAVLGYKLWENPLLLQEAKEMLFSPAQKEDVYQPQIDQLQQQLLSLQAQLAEVAAKAEKPDFSAIDKRVDDIQQISVNTIKSKADVETVLGLIGRMDNAEGRINDLAKVTDDSALVLTAAMLVKDAGQRGGTFVYEAEVLSELAAGHHKIAQEVARLNEIAALGVPTVEELQKEFAAVYVARYPEASAVEELPADNWKDRIYSQLHKVVQIKKPGDASVTVEPKFSEEDRAWSVIRDFVLAGEISKAVAIAKKPLNADVLEDKQLADWLKHAEIYTDFNDSVSRISANALAVMKVKFLRGEK